MKSKSPRSINGKVCFFILAAFLFGICFTTISCNKRLNTLGDSECIGDYELLYRVKVEKDKYHPDLLNETIAILKKRIKMQGVLTCKLYKQGERKILIKFLGATKNDIKRFKQRIARSWILEFRLAAPLDSREYEDAKEGKDVPGFYKHWLKKKKGEEGKTQDWYLVRDNVELTGEYFSRVFSDRKGVQTVIGFEFNQIGRAKFERLTERNIGQPLAIILDDVLYSASLIRDRIPRKGFIEGNFTQNDVNDMIVVMRAGSLPADLELEMETTVELLHDVKDTNDINK